MKRFIVIGFLALLGCSDPAAENPNPNPNSPSPIPDCESSFTGIVVPKTFAYTGDTFTITGSRFCIQDILGILINSTEVPVSVGATTLYFRIPSGTYPDSVSLKIVTDTAVVDLNKKIAIYSSSGTWTEVQSFPGAGRWSTQHMSDGGSKGYISGGQQYTGYSAGSYNYTYYNQLYEYDAEGNSWSLLDSNDNFKNKESGAVADGKFYLLPNTVLGPATTYTVDSKTFASTGSFSSYANSKVPFTVGANVYACTAEATKKIYIKKYNAGNNTWDVVKDSTHTSEQTPIMNFAFEFEGKAYIGYNFLNSNVCELLIYDPNTNQITKGPAIGTSEQDFPVLHHLFTINNIAYFIGTGSASVGPTNSTLLPPGSTLYLYNLKTNAWRSLAHTFPETFFKVSSFTLNNRGFAGLGVSLASPGFNYSQKFYEFIPK